MGVKDSLKPYSDIEIARQGRSGEEALTILQQFHPDVMLLDLSLPGMSGMDCLREVRKRQPELPVVILSMHDERLYAETVLRLGALGYVMKTQSPETLAEAIRSAASNRVHLSARLTAQLIRTLPRRQRATGDDGPTALTAREHSIFRLIAQGCSTREIARQLGVNPKTVDVHRSRIRRKLGVPSSADLILFAVRWLDTHDSEGHLEESAAITGPAGGKS